MNRNERDWEWLEIENCVKLSFGCGSLVEFARVVSGQCKGRAGESGPSDDARFSAQGHFVGLEVSDGDPAACVKDFSGPERVVRRSLASGK